MPAFSGQTGPALSRGWPGSGRGGLRRPGRPTLPAWVEIRGWGRPLPYSASPPKGAARVGSNSGRVRPVSLARAPFARAPPTVQFQCDVQVPVESRVADEGMGFV